MYDIGLVTRENSRHNSGDIFSSMDSDIFSSMSGDIFSSMSGDIFSSMGGDTGLANIETWKLLGSLLSRVDSLGWSDSECLNWMRENIQAMQNRSPMGHASKNEKKRSAEETSGLEKTKRPRLVHERNDADVDAAVGEDDGTAAGDMDDNDDGSDWDAGDNSDCSSDTGCDSDEDDNRGLATIFQELKERAASRRMASRAATQNSPSETMADTALFQEPPPPYTSFKQPLPNATISEPDMVREFDRASETNM